MKITKLNTPRRQVGEGPVWDVQDQALYFVDIVGKVVCRYTPETEETKIWEVPGIIGSMAIREQGGALLALKDGLYTLDFDTGVSTPLCLPEGMDPREQFNDGKVDRMGRFVVGTTDGEAREAIGNVYSFANNTLSKIDEGITISNGPCWSPDNKTFYFADSRTFDIYAYDYDLATGATANRRVFANTKELGGIPDGATVDSDGLLWSAICEGAKIVAYRPDGKLERVIDMPGINLTASVMFGGPKLDQLYVTTLNPSAIPFLGREGKDGEGETYVIEGLGAVGIAEPRFKG